MPICIECRYPIETLYTSYSKADDKAAGKGVRLTQCPRCKRFADKYVEHDFVILFIDLVLIKPQVYRHLLFNRLGREDGQFDPSILRLGILLLLFDVYLTWARIEKTTASSPDSPTLLPSLSAAPLLIQYFFYLLLCTLSTLAFHLPIRLLCAHQHLLPFSAKLQTLQILPHYAHPATLSTALIVSSCSKLFPILLIVWEYDLPSAATAVSWAVIVNNVAALEILMDCGFVRASALVAIGAACRGLVAWLLLGVVGLQDRGLLRSGDLGMDVMVDWGAQAMASVRSIL